MISFPQFLLESSICLLAFYLFYHLILRKETFFQLNRIFLLSSPILAILIPLLNINLPLHSTEINSGSFDRLLYPAVQQAQSVNAYIWQHINRPTTAFSLSIGELLLFLYFIGASVMLIRLTTGLVRLFRLIRKNKRLKTEGYTVVEMDQHFPASSFFSYIFWNEQNIPEDKKLIFEHELVHVRQFHSIDVLLMEFWVILKWYNPLIYLYRNALQTTHEYIADKYVSQKAPSVYQYASLLIQHSHDQSCAPLLNTFAALIKKRLVMLGQSKSKWYRSLKYIWSIPLFSSLMLLFSFNLVDELPQNSLTNSLSAIESYLEDLGDKTVLSIEKQHPYQSVLDWGGVEFSLTKQATDRSLDFEIKTITKEAFQQINTHQFIVKKLYETDPIQSFDALIETSNGKIYAFKNEFEQLHQFSSNVADDFTLYLKLLDSNDEIHYSILSVGDQFGLYRNQINQNEFFNQPTYFSYTISDKIESTDLENLGKNQYYLEWNDRQFQAVKSGNPMKEPFDIQSITLSEFDQLRNENFNLVYNNSCLLIDSVYTMVSNETGAQYKCKDKWDDLACNRDFLYEIRDNSTVYLVIKTKLGDLFSSIISVGDESTLYLEDETFYSEMQKYTHFPNSNPNIKLLPSEDYQLFWGDLSIQLSKETPNQPIEGNIEITRTELLKALKNEPVLGLTNGQLLDQISFDVSLHSSKMNRGFAIGQLSSDSSNTAYFENPILQELEKNITEVDKIHLTQIKYNDLATAEISATIYLKDEPTFKAQKVAKRSKYFHFHWGLMDVNLTTSEKKQFHADLEISKADFQKSILQNPVLTSNKTGVFSDFGFELNFNKEKYTVQSTLNNPENYTNSLDIDMIQNAVKVGDTFFLKRISSETLKEDLLLEIRIIEPTDLNVKTAKYKDRMVLDWGGFDFDLRQLNEGNRTPTQSKPVTLSPYFFKNLVCGQPLLFHKGQLNHIVEADLVIKDGELVEHYKTANWENRDGIIEQLENACEESQISLFFKTKERRNYVLQFRLSEDLADEEITFGQDSTQVINTLLKDYTNNTVLSSQEKTKAEAKIKFPFTDKKVEVIWGENSYELEQKKDGFMGHQLETFISKEDLELLLYQHIEIMADGKIENPSEIHIYGYTKSAKDHFRYVFAKQGDKLLIPADKIDDLFSKIDQSHGIAISFGFSNFSVKKDDISIPLANIQFSFSGSTSSWIPNIKTQKYDATGSTFPFQMVNRTNRHTLVRMDTTNKKYEWMVESYLKNPTVELIHIDDFKTHERVITNSVAKLRKEDINKEEILTKNPLHPMVFPDFHAFDKKTIHLNWREFQGSSFDTEIYCLDDFKKSNGNLDLTIDGVSHKILQFDLYCIDENGITTHFVTDKINRKEINKTLKKTSDRMTLVFNKIIIETPDEKTLHFPMQFNFYLE